MRFNAREYIGNLKNRPTVRYVKTGWYIFIGVVFSLFLLFVIDKSYNTSGLTGVIRSIGVIFLPILCFAAILIGLGQLRVFAINYAATLTGKQLTFLGMAVDIISFGSAAIVFFLLPSLITLSPLSYIAYAALLMVLIAFRRLLTAEQKKRNLSESQKL